MLGVKLKFSNKRKLVLRKDPLLATICELFYVADPLFMGKDVTAFMYMSEARMVVKRLRSSSSSGVSESKCARYCMDVFSNMYSEKEVTMYGNWSELGTVIKWLVENEGKWVNDSWTS